LRSRVAVRLHPDRYQTKHSDQAKRGDTEGESQLDKRKRVYPPEAESHFL
jgi:hypothetical protein